LVDADLCRCRTTNVYDEGVVRETYRWDDESLARIAASGVPWRQVSYLLHETRPRVRWHIGSVLRLAGLGQDGRWLAVTLVEESEDAYLVVTARYLDSDEQETIRKMLEGGGH